MGKIETLIPRLDRVLQSPRRLAGRTLSIEGAGNVVFSTDSKDSHSLHIDPLLDSTLIYHTNTVERAVANLASPEVTGTTKRELFDRTLRAVGRQALDNNVSYEVYAEIEKTARSFYSEYHRFGNNQSVVFDQDILQAVAEAPIERNNRSLAASMWEKNIYDTTDQEAVFYYDQYPNLQPIVVSVAFGGNEPALLLSSMLENCPVVNLRIDKDIKTHSYLGADEIGGDNAIFFVVDDTRKSGSTIGYAEKAIQSDFYPQIMKSVIVQDYSKTHRF